MLIWLKLRSTLVLGTFNPVEVEDLSKHKMDSEELIIDASAADMVNKAKVAGHVFVLLEQLPCAH